MIMWTAREEGAVEAFALTEENFLPHDEVMV